MREQGGSPRIAGEARAQLVTDLRARYEQGVGIRALAESTGLSYGFVRDALKAAGATLRPRGRRRSVSNTR